MTPALSLLISTPCAATIVDVFSGFNSMTQTFGLDGGSQLSCNKSTGEYSYYTEISFSCNFSFNANGYGISWTDVGKWQWIDSWFMQDWYGKPYTYYDFSMRTNATGTVDARGWNGKSEARLGIHDLYSSGQSDYAIAQRSGIVWWTSDTEYLTFDSQSFDDYKYYSGRSGKLTFGMGAWIAGWGSVMGAGYNSTSGSLFFTNTVTIAESTRRVPYVQFSASSYNQNSDSASSSQSGTSPSGANPNTVFDSSLPLSNIEPTPVPEPNTIFSLLSLAVGVGGFKLLKRRNA